MRTFIFVFLLIYTGITIVFAVSTFRGQEPLPRKIIPLTTSTLWILSMASIFVPALAAAREWLQYLFFGALFLEGFEYVRDYQAESPDADLSAEQNRIVNIVSLLAATVAELPAILITLFHLWPDRSAALYLGSVAAVLLGVVLAIRSRPVSAFEPNAIREMKDWLSSPLELGRHPDEIRLIDERRQSWPGLEKPVRTALVAFRYDEEWNVGLVGPITFAFAGKQLSPEDPEKAYEEYRAWYRKQRIRSLERALHEGTRHHPLG
jgi:hypothetical protein